MLDHKEALVAGQVDVDEIINGLRQGRVLGNLLVLVNDELEDVEMDCLVGDESLGVQDGLLILFETIKVHSATWVALCEIAQELVGKHELALPAVNVLADTRDLVLVDATELLGSQCQSVRVRCAAFAIDPVVLGDVLLDLVNLVVRVDGHGAGAGSTRLAILDLAVEGSNLIDGLLDLALVDDELRIRLYSLKIERGDLGLELGRNCLDGIKCHGVDQRAVDLGWDAHLGTQIAVDSINATRVLRWPERDGTVRFIARLDVIGSVKAGVHDNDIFGDARKVHACRPHDKHDRVDGDSVVQSARNAGEMLGVHHGIAQCLAVIAARRVDTDERLLAIRANEVEGEIFDAHPGMLVNVRLKSSELGKQRVNVHPLVVVAEECSLWVDEDRVLGARLGGQ
ncbi:hypothetical protein BC831DRAFT_458439 [Entophlyctis helioformis]|nr:hypothetical protein BC831DRAFT_458439 [Entophlyctis helioformis]